MQAGIAAELASAPRRGRLSTSILADAFRHEVFCSRDGDAACQQIFSSACHAEAILSSLYESMLAA